MSLCGTPTFETLLHKQATIFGRNNFATKTTACLKPFSIKLDVGSVSVTGVPPTSPSGEKKAAQ